MDIRIKKIMCTMDFSEYTVQMLRYGVALSKSFSARLLIFHSVVPPEGLLYSTGIAERSGELENKAERAVERIQQLMAPYDIRWTALAAKGDPVDTAARTARKEEVDLVVSVSRNFSILKRFFLGKVVERMARGLDRPFLVLRPPRPSSEVEIDAPLRFDNVLVGCDLTGEAGPTVDYGRYFAGHYGSRLHLLHTLESPVGRDFDNELEEGGYDEVQRKMLERLKQRLLDLCPESGDEPVQTVPVVETGLPGEALTLYANKIDADLMVVGAKRLGALEKLLVGSTTEAVLRRSPCPVLVISPSAGQNES